MTMMAKSIVSFLVLKDERGDGHSYCGISNQILFESKMMKWSTFMFLHVYTRN